MNFLWSGRTYEIKKETLERAADKAFFVLGEKPGRIEGKFVSRTEISRLNQVYRGKEEATDVLSFLLEAEPVEGQIFICYTYAKKEAERAGLSVEREITKLIVHGIGHLFGIDHKTAKEEIEMEQISKEILERING